MSIGRPYPAAYRCGVDANDYIAMNNAVVCANLDGEWAQGAALADRVRRYARSNPAISPERAPPLLL